MSNVPEPGVNVPPVAELWNLLHFDRAKAKTQLNGRYGRLHSFTWDDLERHLAGEITLAFSVLSGQLALFAPLDVDALFPELLPAIRTAVVAIGGEELYSAIFCTNGSDDGRGKIIVTFTEPLAASDARTLLRRLYDRVRASEAAQYLDRRHLTAYPQGKSGGVVRVLGRNAWRGGPIETAFSLDAVPGLSHVRPLSPRRLAEIVSAVHPKIAAWAERRIETPWVRLEPKGTYAHFGHMIALAREAIRIYGPQERGQGSYYEWLDRINANSPELSLPSQHTKDPRNVLDHARERAWKYAIERPQSWEPLDLHIRKGVPRGVIRVYHALVAFVRRNGLRPARFGIDYERIAEAVGSPKTTAYRWVQRADEIGVLVIYDRGTRRTKGARGQCAQLGLVCHGEAQEQVRAAGRRK